MAMSRQKIAEVIENLSVGDVVTVVWEDAEKKSRSTETGTVWDPSDSPYLGLGPDLLNPTDLELVSIVVNSRVLISIPEPGIGSVAVFQRTGTREIHAFKRLRRGWYQAGEGGPYTWALIVNARWTLIQVYRQGTPPAVPTITSLTPGDRRIEVVANLGSSGSTPITDVQYNLVFEEEEDFEETSGWRSSEQTTGTFMIPNLINGVAFTVRLRSINQSGPGVQSAPSIATPRGVPYAPSNVVAVPGNAQASLTWNAPTDNNGAAVTSYRIEKILASNNDGWVVAVSNTNSATTAFTVTGLTNDVLTGFRVSAINAAGVGFPSVGSVGVTPTD